MALSAGQIEKAKADARELLEYSVYVLSLMLAVDPLTLSGDMEIPVETGHPSYHAYECLVRQAKALESLG